MEPDVGREGCPRWRRGLHAYRPAMDGLSPYVEVSGQSAGPATLGAEEGEQEEPKLVVGSQVGIVAPQSDDDGWGGHGELVRMTLLVGAVWPWPMLPPGISREY